MGAVFLIIGLPTLLVADGNAISPGGYSSTPGAVKLTGLGIDLAPGRAGARLAISF